MKQKYNLEKLFNELTNVFSLEIVDKFKQIIYKIENENWRYYHNVNHILYFFPGNILPNNGNLTFIKAYTIAAFYHDAIYDPTKNDNEDLSNSLMRLDLKNLESKEVIDLASKMILATKNHEFPNDVNIQKFINMDLRILMSNSYLKYRKNIRKEYKHVSYDVYKIHRKKFLQSMLIKLTKNDYFSHFPYKNFLTNNLFNIEKASKNINKEVILLSYQEIMYIYDNKLHFFDCEKIINGKEIESEMWKHKYKNLPDELTKQLTDYENINANVIMEKFAVYYNIIFTLVNWESITEKSLFLLRY